MFDVFWIRSIVIFIKCRIGDKPLELVILWWRHQMETFSALLALCAGNSLVTEEFPSPRPVSRSLMISLICAWINGSVNNSEAGDLRRHRVHYDVIVMLWQKYIIVMMTSYLGRFYITGLLCGDIHRWIRWCWSFDVFLVASLNKLLSSYRWFQTPCRS